MKMMNLKEMTKELCKSAIDKEIIRITEEWKQMTFCDGSTWFEGTEEYFKKYLTKFGRTELITYLYRNN
jgi:hypothetical protein